MAMQAVKSERCRGCGSRFVLAPSGHSQVKDWGLVLCEHLIHRPPCAECYFDLGQCIEWDGKIVVKDSLHCKKYIEMYGLVGCSNQGKLLQFGDSQEVRHIHDKLERMRLAPLLVPEGEVWRGKTA